jgi:hypothetical protein
MLHLVGRLTPWCHPSQVRAELDKARMDLEKEGRSTQVGKLCATPFGVDIVGITELVALIGALVGGKTLGCCCHGLPSRRRLMQHTTDTHPARQSC